LRRGVSDPTTRSDAAGGWWRTARTPAGPGTLHLRPLPRGGVRAAAWGTGADWLLAGLPDLLGAGDDWSGFEPSHPLLADTWRRCGGVRLGRAGLVMEMLAPAILEQKVTGVEARRAWRWLVLRHGSPPPGPAPAGMAVVPSPEQWRRVPSWDWHRAGVDASRSRTLVEAAALAPHLEKTLELGRGGPSVSAVLQSLRGVGPWTAAEVAQRAHGDPDAVSVGDYHLPSVIGWALAGRPLDDDGMLEVLAPWAGHRQRVVRLVELSGAGRHRFGPRLTIADHRRR
jgi:3-methyladenine DNA glycosylase/8-oxoguanine DNA glycosylase